jgi:hypothetical protein
MLLQRQMRRIITAAGAVLLAACPALAGEWIRPNFPAGQEPQHRPVPLYWFEVNNSPLIYRTEIEVPEGATRATALLRTAGYVYVCVNGQQVFSWQPVAADEKNNRPAQPADPNRVHAIDLTEHLTPGRHVLTVSAPAGGFVIDGGIYARNERVVPIESSGRWTVTKFAPTTIVEDEPIMKLGYTGPAAPTRAGEQWTAPAEQLAQASANGQIRRSTRKLDDAIWRLELIARKGIYIAEDTAWGWGGANRLGADVQREANALLQRATTLQPQLKALTAETGWRERNDVARGADELERDMLALTQRLAIADERKALELASSAIPGVARNPQDLPAWRSALTRQLGHEINKLNESRYDRLGWMPHPGLTDSQIGSWGVRINPVTGPTTVRAPRQWLFATDPRNTGEQELRWTIGYNIEPQMGRINVPGNWAADERNAERAHYTGFAWYRARIEIPDEWAGNEVILRFRVGGQEKFWINDNDVTSLGTGNSTPEGQADRVYRLPPSMIAFGGENFLALKIDARGRERGILSDVQASCPALAGPEGKQTPPVTVLSTPLSPAVVLTPQTDTLQIHHTGRSTLMISGDAGAKRTAYTQSQDGRLKQNWALVWLQPAMAASAERPILLVFQDNPVSIATAEGVTTVKLPQAGQRIIAVRPWAKADPKALSSQQVASAIELWSRAALAVPVNYMNVTRVLQKGEPYANATYDNVPKGPVLGHTVVYDYLTTSDTWGTQPLRIAPLPALASYGIDTRFRNLQLDQAQQIQVLQDGGLAAPYRGIINADRISYSYDVEPFPRFMGFTSWMFSGADAGVRGNQRELELMAAAGANSYRPQHNWSDQRPPAGQFPASDTRTRAQVTADYCNAVGINYMNNIEQTLDRQREVRADYHKWLETRLYPHFERLVPTLADRPFWAVAWDLINEPFDHRAEHYNPAMKELTRRVRAHDPRHLLYIEPCQAWGAIQQLRLIEPTGDPMTYYSFHDYNFRLNRPDDRWPTLQRDITNICQMWWPAFEFPIKYGTGMHCGEFGGFSESSNDSLAQKTLMNDLFKIFDQFGMHHHYYSGRQIFERAADGSMRPSNVVRVYREYFKRPDVNAYYELWPEHPRLQ